MSEAVYFNSESLRKALDTLSIETEHARGVIDTLALLGLIRFEGSTPQPAGKVTAMLIDVLRAHVTDGVPVSLDWDDLDRGDVRGVDILLAIETARVAAVNAPTPARQVQTADAVIKTRQGGEDAYLMQYDLHARRYQPIGGKMEIEDAGLEAALRREVAEELRLDSPPGSEVLVVEEIGTWQETALSATYGLLTRYRFTFFAARQVGFPLKIDSETHWLRRSELLSGVAEDGRPITPIYQQALGIETLDDLELTVMVGG
jgi:8-oxo-dGTP pyrophosphatase MutT (NUDIX family)